MSAAGTSCSGLQTGPRCVSHTCKSSPQLRSGLLGSPINNSQCISLSGTSLQHQSRTLTQRRRAAQTTMMAAKGAMLVLEEFCDSK